MAEKGSWWRTLSGGRLFSRGNSGESKRAPKSEVAQSNEGKSQGTEQVSPVLRELLARQEQLLREHLQRQDPAGVSSMLSRELREEAERQAASVRMRAIREGEVEAARIVAEARRQAQEILGNAQREAQEASQSEVENIIAAARQKAEIAEDRAKQIAQLFLIRAREDIHSIVTGEAKEGYYRLLSALQEVIAASHSIEKEWKDRSVQLWENSAFRWEEYQSALLKSVGQGQLSAPEFTPEAGSAMPGEQALQATPPADDVTVGPDADSVAVAATGEAPAEPGLASSEMGVEVTPSQVEATATVPATDVGQEAMGTTSFQEEILSGAVEIVIAPFTDVERLANLYRHLQTVSGIRVLQSTGSWEKGTVLTAALDRPLALSDVVPLALGARASLERGKSSSEDEAGQHFRIALEFPAG